MWGNSYRKRRIATDGGGTGPGDTMPVILFFVIYRR
jgi:hypothetical protein